MTRQELHRLASAACRTRHIGREILPALVGRPQDLIIEYSSPNVAKPFHIGHLRGTLQGQFVCNVMRSAGHNVHSVNWLGDWGTQFGLLTRAWQSWAEPDRLNGRRPLDYLHELYVRANMRATVDKQFAAEARQAFAAMENKEDGSMDFWHVANDISRREFDKIYEQLNVSFDETVGESEYAADGQQLVDSLLDTGVAEVSFGSVGVFIPSPNQKDEPYFVNLRKSDSSTLYITRDIVTAMDRWQRHKPSRILYVVDHGQSDHFKCLQGVLHCMGHTELANAIEHVKCGRVQHMSSRTGKVVHADSLFDLARRKAVPGYIKRRRNSTLYKLPHSEVKDIYRQLAVSLLVLNLLKERRTSDYTFV